MDAAPRSFDELPADPELGVPVPFAAGTDVGTATPRRRCRSATSTSAGSPSAR